MLYALFIVMKVSICIVKKKLANILSKVQNKTVSVSRRTACYILTKHNYLLTHTIEIINFSDIYTLLNFHRKQEAKNAGSNIWRRFACFAKIVTVILNTDQLCCSVKYFTSQSLANI